MTKHIRNLLVSLLFITIAVIMAVLPVFSATSDSITYGGVEYPVVTIKINGKSVSDMNALLINGTTMVPFRAICEAIKPDEGTISWNEKLQASTYSSYLLQIRAQDGDCYIKANNRYFYNETPITIINGTMYVPLRTMAKAFSTFVEWNGSERSANLIPTGKTLLSASAVYDSDELLVLSRIINSESRFEPLKGKIAVGNVVMNRVAHWQFPNTVEEVVFDQRNGVTQFQPITSPVFYEDPTAESIIAAKIVLEGYTVSTDILYYLNIDLATNMWIVEICTSEMKIGNHSFYS